MTRQHAGTCSCIRSAVRVHSSLKFPVFGMLAEETGRQKMHQYEQEHAERKRHDFSRNASAASSLNNSPVGSTEICDRWPRACSPIANIWALLCVRRSYVIPGCRFLRFSAISSAVCVLVVTPNEAGSRSESKQALKARQHQISTTRASLGLPPTPP